MPSIAVPDVTGDVKLTWDPDNPEEVRHARDHFEKLKKAGHLFFKVRALGKKGTLVDSFDEGLGKLICEFDPKADVIAAPVPRGG